MRKQEKCMDEIKKLVKYYVDGNQKSVSYEL